MDKKQSIFFVVYEYFIQQKSISFLSSGKELLWLGLSVGLSVCP